MRVIDWLNLPSAEEQKRGHRYKVDCCDCGEPMYQFFDRATQLWSERARHMEGNCVQNLRKRIEALEMAREGAEMSKTPSEVIFTAAGGVLLPKSDPVNHPAHYTSGGIEVIAAIEAWALGYHLGNAVKYIARAGKKTPDKVEDLRKAKWYIERELARADLAALNPTA